MKSTAITENTSVYETDGRQNGPSVLRPQFAHQFSALVAHRPQKVEDRLPRAVVEIGFIKTAAHHLEKFGHRAMFASKRHAQTVADPRPPVEGKQASLDWSAALTPDVAMIISNIKSRSSFRGNK